MYECMCVHFKFLFLFPEYSFIRVIIPFISCSYCITATVHIEMIPYLQYTLHSINYNLVQNIPLTVMRLSGTHCTLCRHHIISLLLRDVAPHTSRLEFCVFSELEWPFSWKDGPERLLDQSSWCNYLES